MKRLRLFIIFLSISIMSGCGADVAYDEPPAEPVVTASVPEQITEEAIVTEPPVVTPSIEEIDTSVNIIMVGDILLHTPVEEAAKNDETGIYDFDFIFDNSKDKISSADIAIANEEVIIGGEELKVSGYPAFNAPYEIGDALYDAGFDVICHATNHALDKGKKGIINCLDYWRSAHPDMIVTGIYDNEADASN
ncbi:MAG: CapA family protein, partial [Lachnospiraceae bacterium]|nr:CapA family protein [Lachnospiraceae bacterium]